jgi:hypothetical protein
MCFFLLLLLLRRRLLRFLRRRHRGHRFASVLQSVQSGHYHHRHTGLFSFVSSRLVSSRLTVHIQCSTSPVSLPFASPTPKNYSLAHSNTSLSICTLASVSLSVTGTRATDSSAVLDPQCCCTELRDRVAGHLAPAHASVTFSFVMDHDDGDRGAFHGVGLLKLCCVGLAPSHRRGREACALLFICTSACVIVICVSILCSVTTPFYSRACASAVHLTPDELHVCVCVCVCTCACT